MSLYCYFFKYNLDTSSFELCDEASGVEEAGIARLKQDPKELYIEWRFASPQEDVSRIADEVNRKYQDSTYFRCKDCGKVAYLTPDETWWFKSKGFDLPKRCYSCRLRRKAAKKVSEEG